MAYSKQHHRKVSTPLLAVMVLFAFLVAVICPAPHASAQEPTTQEHHHDHGHNHDEGKGDHDPNHHFHSYGGEIDHTPVTLHYIKPIKETTGFAGSWDMPPNEQVPANSQQTPKRPPRS